MRGGAGRGWEDEGRGWEEAFKKYHNVMDNSFQGVLIFQET